MGKKLALTIFAALGILWYSVQAGNAAHPVARASVDLGTPGAVSSLPQANGVGYGTALPPATLAVSARQAINTAEQEYGLTDAQIDPTARATPVVVSVGLSPTEQNMHVWVVTAHVKVALRAPTESGKALSNLCILIDASTGKYIMAYGAGPLVNT
jgi:hypothetical protein